MKKKLMSIFVVTALMLAITPTSPAFQRHPEIRAALHALHNAKEHLRAAAHDYRGHREEAIRAIDEAIHQLEICMEFD
jgi:hypothetical protein